MCTSTRVEGPWACSFVTDVKPPWNNDMHYIAYAAKAHPELGPYHHSNIHTFPYRYGKVATDTATDTSKGTRDLKNSSTNIANVANGKEVIISIVPNTLQGFAPLYEEAHYLAYTPKFFSLRHK